MWLCLFCVLTRILISSTGVTTLVKDNNITCVLTGDSVYSALHLSVELRWGYEYGTTKLRRPLVEITDWVNDDWRVIHSAQSNLGPVTDIRWENFSSTAFYELWYNVSYGNTFSFSVCHENSNFDIVLFADDLFRSNLYIVPLFQLYSQNNSNFENRQKYISSEDLKKHLESTPKNNNIFKKQILWEWRHYRIMLKKNSIIMEQLNKQPVKKDTNFIIKHLRIFNKHEFLVRPHYYTFKYSDIISRTKVSYLNISNISNSTQICISMFVSLDEACYLKIILDSDNQLTNKTETGFNKEGDFKRWKRIEIEGNYNGTGTLSLIRKRWDGGEMGYWAIDKIHQCKHKLDVYRTTLPHDLRGKDVTCKVLKVTSEDNIFCEKPGYIGSNCSTSCQDILGSSYPFCQNHLICLENNTCQCAWGFQKPHCKERCKIGYWGLDCSLKCNDLCTICDAIEGCIKCKNNFFGNDCSAKYPILLNPPVLINITEDSFVVNFDLKYGINETRPDFYQIQYREISAKTYRNYSNPKGYSNRIETVTMTIMLTTTKSYHIRMILLLKDQAFVDNIPELICNKKSLIVSNVSDLEMTLEWSRPYTTNIDNYILDYECDEFCSENLQKNSMPVISKATTKIKDLKIFAICTVKLFLNTENQKQLIDRIDVKNLEKKVNESELPKTIILKNNTITVKLDTCDKFSGPLNYDIIYKCNSAWCDPNKKINLTIDLNKYNKSVERQLEKLPAFTAYEIEVTARRSQKLIKTYLQTTPSSKPSGVENLSIYCSNGSALSIRWQKPYPPTGVIEHYKIKYQKNGGNTTYSQCDLWDNFLCATISGLEYQTIYNISVQAKNVDIPQLGDANFLKISTVQEATHAPENLKIQLMPKTNELNLTWNHPLYTNNCPLQLFYIKINNEIFNITVKKYQHSYNYTISVEEKKHYDISVWGVNEMYADKAVINATVFPPISKFSPNNFVEWCSERCYLLVPKPSQNANFEIMVMHREKIFSKYKSLKNRFASDPGEWIVNFTNSNDKNEVQLEIDQKEGKAVSISNSNYIMYLVLNESENSIYPIKYEKSATDDVKYGNFYIKPLIALIVTNVVTLLLGIFYYAYKHKTIIPFLTTQRHRNHSNVHRSSEDVTLLSVVNEEKSTIVQLQNLESYVRNNVSMTDNLIKQMKCFPVEKAEPCAVALRSKNINKNKDTDNIPYDFNRVILTTMKGVGRDDYINASCVDGFDRAKAYIVCQGPKFYTVRDFWRMIWQEQIETVVMATNFMDDKQRMCAEYWTERLDTIFDCGEMTIKLIKEITFEHYIHRIFEVQYMCYSRQVQHFQLKWSLDNQIPFYPNNAVPLVKRIREISEHSPTPILIHSGFGANRSGTLLLCDLALQMIRLEESVDFCGLLKTMRGQRANIVNKLEYYVLAHLIVLECIMEETNPFKRNMEENIDADVIKQQLSYLERLSWHDTAIGFKAVQLTGNGPLRPIFVDGYKKQKKYLVAKQPTKQSVTEFWILIAKERINYILFLNVLEKKLWPHMDVGSEAIVRVRYLKDATPDDTQCYRQTQLSLLTYDKKTKKVLNQSEVYVLELNGWSSRQIAPTSADNILNVISYLNKVTIESTTSVLLACRNGTNASGLFAALSYVIEKYENEIEFDVCNALRILKRSHSQFMNNPKQIKFLYSAILEYKQKYDKYSCIEE